MEIAVGQPGRSLILYQLEYEHLDILFTKANPDF